MLRLNVIDSTCHLAFYNHTSAPSAFNHVGGQDRHSDHTPIHNHPPSMKKPLLLFLFPGQGAQYAGMGSDLHAQHEIVRHTYEEAVDTLGYDITHLSFADSDRKINLTRYTQPAILTHSVACLRLFSKLTQGQLLPDVTAGHSLGEYSALVAAGVLDFTSALRLVSTRGELMSTHGDGEMEALPLDLQASARLAEKHYCAIAACNLPDQTVVGGHASDLDNLAREFTDIHPKKRSTRLKTEGAFHTYLMIEAAKRFRPVLEDTVFQITDIQVLSNYTGDFHESDSASIRSRLFLQLFHPVLWHQNLVSAIESGVTTVIEFGGGIGKGTTPAEKNPNIASIVKRAFRGAERIPTYHAVINTGTLEQTLATLDSSAS